MLDVILVIATLCQVTGSASNSYRATFTYEEAQTKQVNCQKMFLSCYIKQGSLGSDGARLATCVMSGAGSQR